MIKKKVLLGISILCFVLGCSKKNKISESKRIPIEELNSKDTLSTEIIREMDWRKITSHLYENINPENGRLNSYFNDQYYEPFINFTIEFDMNEFIYEDPFYGEQKSTAPFKMNVDLFEVTESNKIKGINEFENLTIINKTDKILGAFSNSLDIVAHEINFGRIKGKFIEFEMKYSLVNSYSYGMMNGTREEHLQSIGNIKTDLKITNLVLNERKDRGNNIEEKVARLDKEIYDLNSYLSNSVEENEYSKKYEISYKDLKFSNNESPQNKIVL